MIDPIIGGAIVSGVGSLASSAFNFGAQREQRSWEERMANSAYQRSAADMRKAGLNPSMMFGSGGAAQTPNVAPPEVSNPLEHAPEVAATSAKVALDTQRVANETNVATAEVARKAAETENLRLGNPNVGLQGDKLRQEIINLAAELSGIRARTRQTTASARETEAGLPRKEAVGGAIKDVLEGRTPFEKPVQAILDKVLGKPDEVREAVDAYKRRSSVKNNRAWNAIKGFFVGPGAAGGGSSARDVGR